MPDLSFLTARPIAHRGLHAISQGIVENCETAFGEAIRHDYAIECDVQLSGDGEAMVFHDFTLDRLTESVGALRDYDAAALMDVQFLATDDRMQTLSDLLHQVDGRVALIIELKSAHEQADLALVDAVLSALERYQGPYALMSFDPALVKRVRMLSPATICGIVSCAYTHPDDAKSHSWLRRFMLKHMLHMPFTRPHFISYGVKDLPSPVPTLWRTLLKRPLICWTTRSEEEDARARRWVDQVTFEHYRP